MNAKLVAPPALMHHLELLRLTSSEMGLDPPMANAFSLRGMTREERTELADFLGSLIAEPPAKPEINRIYFYGPGRLAPYRDEIPGFLETVKTMDESEQAAKKAEPTIKRRHRKPR